MPYPSDTRVPGALLRILDARVGRPRASRLLHDHLDDPKDLVTRSALIVALGGTVEIRRGLGLHTPHGYEPVTELVFETKIGGQTWNGDTIDVQMIPDTLRSALPGRPLKNLIDNPFLAESVVSEIDEHDEGAKTTTIRLIKDVQVMRDIQPTYAERFMTRRRRWLRRVKLARRLDAHTGFRLWIPPLSLFAGLVCSFLSLLLSAVILGPIIGMEQAGPIVTLVVLIMGVTGFAVCWLLCVNGVDKNRIVDDHAERAIDAAVRAGI